MSKQLKVKIITPEKLLLEEMADQVSIPTVNGEITVLPDHIPIVAELAHGDVVSFVGGEPKPFAVMGGFIVVKQNKEWETEVTILADFAEHVSELSDDRIEQAKKKAEEMKKQMGNNEVVDFEHFETELERSLTRIKISDKWSTKKYRS